MKLRQADSRCCPLCSRRKNNLCISSGGHKVAKNNFNFAARGQGSVVYSIEHSAVESEFVGSIGKVVFLLAFFFFFIFFPVALLSLQQDISIKILAAPSMGQKHRCKGHVWGQSKKARTLCSSKGLDEIDSV